MFLSDCIDLNLSSRPHPTVQPGAGGCCLCFSWTRPIKPMSCLWPHSKTAWDTSALSLSTFRSDRPPTPTPSPQHKSIVASVDQQTIRVKSEKSSTIKVELFSWTEWRGFKKKKSHCGLLKKWNKQKKTNKKKKPRKCTVLVLPYFLPYGISADQRFILLGSMKRRMFTILHNLKKVHIHFFEYITKKSH